MPPFRKPTLVTLRRQQPTNAWGFRLGGGSELGQPFQIQKVTPGSLAFLGGLSEGDELVRIGNISLRGLTHDEVQQIILRCAYCIDLFIIRDDGYEIEPRFVIDRTNIVSERTVPEYENNLLPQLDQCNNQNHQSPSPNLCSENHVIRTVDSGRGSMENSFNVNNRQDFNYSAKPFGENQTTPRTPTAVNASEYFTPVVQQPQLAAPVLETKPGSPIKDTRVFGLNRSSKSPVKLNSATGQPSAPINMANQGNVCPSQSIPCTPTFSKDFSFNPNDCNNNPINGERKIYGLPNKGVVKPITPLGNHGVQPVTNEKKVFGLNPRQRFNSISCDRDWKSSLPIVNIPNTDQLLPSQTKQMQTYINQIPPTEKNLRPSLVGLQRRRIRPVWPPPLPSHNKVGVFIEGRDSPNSKMFNWPPRAQSVDRDFGYGEGTSQYNTPPPGQRGQTPDRCVSPFMNSRVRSSSKQWPPVSNATPAGRSGYTPDDNENYAYTPSREASPGPGWVTSHVPATYRPPPGTQYTQFVNDF